jgi:hypothetical protein
MRTRGEKYLHGDVAVSANDDGCCRVEHAPVVYEATFPNSHPR